MRIFKNTWFARYASRENISDSELKEAVNLLEAGQANANLGGNVYKMRVARPGKGKSGGYRVIVLFKSGEKTFYMYGFAKSERENIDKKELNNFKKAATDYFSMTDKQINQQPRPQGTGYVVLVRYWSQGSIPFNNALKLPRVASS